MLQFTLNDLTPRQLEFVEKAREVFLASPSTIPGYAYNQDTDEQSVLTRAGALRALAQLNARFDDPDFIAQADAILAGDAQDTSEAKQANRFPGGPVDMHVDMFIQFPETIDLNLPKLPNVPGGMFDDMFKLSADLGLDRCEQVAAARAVKAIQAARANMPKGSTGMPTLHDFHYTENGMFECHRCGDSVDYEGKQQRIATGELCVTTPLEEIRRELGIKSSLSAKAQE